MILLRIQQLQMHRAGLAQQLPAAAAQNKPLPTGLWLRSRLSGVQVTQTNSCVASCVSKVGIGLIAHHALAVETNLELANNGSQFARENTDPAFTARDSLAALRHPDSTLLSK